jgi:hypothetical protein
MFGSSNGFYANNFNAPNYPYGYQSSFGNGFNPNYYPNGYINQNTDYAMQGYSNYPQSQNHLTNYMPYDNR